MSIPLVQNNDKDAINTSIIAIKRNIERINMLLGLSNSEEIDTSKFATKEELQQAVTDLQPVDEVTLDNMQSVTSNAVAEAFSKVSYYTTEHKTGKKWLDGKDIYSRSFSVPGIGTDTWTNVTNDNWINNILRIIDCVVSANEIGYGSYGGHPKMRIENGYLQAWEVAGYTAGVMTIEYTKTTD